MRIAFINSKLNLKTGGGGNHSLHMAASKLVDLGHQVMVVTLFPPFNAYPENLPYRVISEGLITNRIDRKYRLALLKALHKYENEVDIYHIWEPWVVPDAALYRRLGGKTPIVAHLNHYYFCLNLSLMDTECYKRCGFMRQIKHRPGNPARKALLLPFRAFEYYQEILVRSHVDAFTAVSPAVAEIYSWRKIDQKKISVIPPSIDYEYLRSLKQNHTSELCPAGRYDILYVGRLCSEKAVDILIDAVSRLQFPLSLHIMGDGPQRKYLEQFSEQLGISDRVFFYGWMSYDEVVNSYLSSQLFVHPGRWPEPFGRTVLDAMALEVPVIAADCGGPPWTLQGAGLTFRPGDVEDLADKIRLMHGNPSLAADLVRRAAERAKDFDYKKLMPMLIDVYKTVLGDKG